MASRKNLRPQKFIRKSILRKFKIILPNLFLRYKNFKIILIIILINIIFLTPFFINPSLILNRNNDLLVAKSWYGFLKFNILNNHLIPLWQNFNLSGSPFVGDPNIPLVYLPNYLSVVFPESWYFFTNFLLSFLISSLGAFCLARSYRLKLIPSLVTAFSYGLSAKFIAHLEAGHPNLLISYSWFPFFIYGLKQLTVNPNITASLLIGISGSAIFLNYITVFIYSIFSGFIFLFVNLRQTKQFKKILIYLIISILLFILISLPQIIAGLLYFPLTTRNLIRIEDIGPAFPSYKRYLIGILFPYYYGLENYHTESILYFGITSLVLAFLGFFYVNFRRKVLILSVTIISLILSLGLKTSLYLSIIQLFPQILLLRITTRFWFIPILIISLLAGFYVNLISRYKKLSLVILLLLISESYIFTRLFFLSHPTTFISTKSIQNKIYNFVTSDSGYYRIYCTTSCIPDVYEKGKGLAVGYNPIQLKNYFYYIQKAGGYRFDSYAPSLPPFQTFVDKPQPNSDYLGILGVRFVVSPYALSDNNFELKLSENGLYVYKNNLEKPRVYLINGKIEALKVVKDLPGVIEFIVSGRKGKIVINEVFTPFWKAYTEKGEQIPVKEEGVVLTINSTNTTKQITLIFKPPFVKEALAVSWLTWLIAFGLLVIKVIRKI